MSRSLAKAGFFAKRDVRALDRLMRLLVMATLCVTGGCGAQDGRPAPAEKKVEHRMREDPGKSTLVDLGADPLAPEPPGIGIAIRLGEGSGPLRFRIGQPVTLHGSYRADLDLIRLCKEGLAGSILLTIHRVDRPWGMVSRLHVSKAPMDQPEPVAGAYDPTYRQSGQFRVDLVQFFELRPEPSRYLVEALIGPYVSSRLDFELLR